MATKINQKEYLKRYLSNDKDKKKKKKKKDKNSTTKKSNVVIVDDDLDLTALQSRIDDNETDLFGLDEEAPQVVGIIDERPPELRAKEDFSGTKWKALEGNDGFDAMLRANDGKRQAGGGETHADKGDRRRKYDSDESPPRQAKSGRSDRGRKDSDESPPRRRVSKEKDFSKGRSKRDDSDESPPRKSAVSKNKRQQDSDESPPRRRRSKEKDVSREKGRRDDSDESPPRKSKANKGSRDAYESDENSARRGRSKEKQDSKWKGRREDSDESPPRKSATAKSSRKHQDSDESAPRRRTSREKDVSRGKGRRADSDESPPRRNNESDKRNRKYDSDRSPPRKQRHHDSDESPPRRRDESPPRRDRNRTRRRSNDSDESPPRKSRHDSKKSSNRRYDSDESPPRRDRTTDRRERAKKSPEKGSQRLNDSDESPPRRGRNEMNVEKSSRSQEQKSSHRRMVSPPVRIKQERKSSDSDLSPPRKSDRPASKGSLEQRIKQEPRSPSTSSSRHAPAERMSKTLDGKRAGLQDAKALREENDKHRAREREALMKLSDEVSGRYAETVVREKGGRRRDVEKELREELAKRKHEEKKKEIYSRWGKGVKQVEDYKTQLEEAAREMEKPLARYADDQDLDEYLKQQEREGDPMLEYLRSKRKEENKRAGIPEKPVYEGAFPDNRYGIRPGYRWDGVDRSNGFEKRWFEAMSKKKAVEEEAYKYSVEDM